MTPKMRLLAHTLWALLFCNGCGSPTPVATPEEKSILRHIQKASDARILLCDSAGEACSRRRDTLLPLCLKDSDCQIFTIRKDRWPWLWEQMKARDSH